MRCVCGGGEAGEGESMSGRACERGREEENVVEGEKKSEEEEKRRQRDIKEGERELQAGHSQDNKTTLQVAGYRRDNNITSWYSRDKSTLQTDYSRDNNFTISWLQPGLQDNVTNWLQPGLQDNVTNWLQPGLQDNVTSWLQPGLQDNVTSVNWHLPVVAGSVLLGHDGGAEARVVWKVAVHPSTRQTVAQSRLHSLPVDTRIPWGSPQQQILVIVVIIIIVVVVVVVAFSSLLCYHNPRYYHRYH